MEGQRDPASPLPQAFDPGADWISDFIRVTIPTATPEIYRKWTAIHTIGAALQRNVWAVTNARTLYTHLYTVLVGPPGTGKTAIIDKAREMLLELKPDLHVAFSSLTPASLIDNLNDAAVRRTRVDSVPAVTIDNCLSIYADELGVLLPAYDPTFMNTLQGLYDCTPYSQKRRSRDISIEIKNPQINILAGCTPAYLQGALPEGAWAEGFTARCIFVFSGEENVSEMFTETSYDTAAFEDLTSRLKKMNRLYGKVGFTEEAKSFINGWIRSGQEPVPDHPKLTHYRTRRKINLVKLSMICAVSSGSPFLVEEHHAERGLDLLIEVEHYIPDIFKSMDNTSHSQILKDVWHYVFETYRREGQKPVVEARILNFISARVPAYAVKPTLEVLERAGYLKRQLGAGGNEYIPKGKSA